MSHSVTHQLIAEHLTGSGSLPAPGQEVGLRIDQTLTQDATGTLVMLALESMGLERARTELSAQYVDHNLLQENFRNPDDHLFLRSACRKFGIWYSGPGNGVSHPVHMQRFGRPGASLLGSDSHTCAAGALGMLAFGAGGIAVAAAIRGEPYYLKMPEVWGIHLRGELPSWVSAKDVILEMLRRHGVSGGKDRIVEYFGPGLAGLSAMDRHVIANMGAELGATTTVFPSDELTREFLARQGREDDWRQLDAGDDPELDVTDEIDLSKLEPLIAKPTSPGNVVPVEEVSGEPIYQSYIGSSANPGLRDFEIAAEIVHHRGPVADGVSFDVNPTSRQLLETMSRDGALAKLVGAGARIHQAGCNGCIGMGQAPATGKNSLRTTPRNFPGRSGTREDSVWLCSPETAAASAVRGEITDPRTLEQEPFSFEEPRPTPAIVGPTPPASEEEAADVELVRGPNIKLLPELDPLPDELEAPVLLSLGDDISTDEILPAGARVLPYRSNLPAISQFCFEQIDEDYPANADEHEAHAIVAGDNYGQGSSREHAAFAPRYLGLRVVLAKSFARIHWQNLIAYGVVPLITDEAAEISPGTTLRIPNLRGDLETDTVSVEVEGQGTLEAEHGLSERQLAILESGGMINWLKAA